MKITPLDIQQQQFKKKGSRYDSSEVDSFLDLVRSELEDQIRDNDLLKERVRLLENQLSDLKDQEKTLKQAILTCQRATEEIIENAKKESEIVVAEARMRGDVLIAQAHSEVARITEELNELKRQRIVFEAELRGILDAHQKLLDGLSRSARQADEESRKVSTIK